METAPQRLDRLLQENNLVIAQNPLTTATITDGSIIVKPSTYTAVFADPAKEKKDEPIPGQTPQETNG